MYATEAVLVSQSRLTPCNPMDCSPPGSSVHGILQVKILEWVAIPFFRRDLPDPGIKRVSLASPTLADEFFTTKPPRKPLMLFHLSINLAQANTYSFTVPLQ